MSPSNRPACSRQFDAVCKAEFERLNGKLDRLDGCLRGSNGEPGMKVRLDRLEQSEVRRIKLLWMIAASVVVLAVSTIWRWLFPGQ